MIFAERIKTLRKELNLTQQDFADKLAKKRSTISGYETDRKQPDYDTLLELADFFDVSVDYLLGKSNIRKLPNDHPVISAFHVEGDEALSDEDIEAVRSIVKQLVEKNRKK